VITVFPRQIYSFYELLHPPSLIGSLKLLDKKLTLLFSGKKTSRHNTMNMTIHRSLSDHRDWGPGGRALPQNCHVVIFKDLVGFGSTDTHRLVVCKRRQEHFLPPIASRCH
jgi:hypothetical protein